MGTRILQEFEYFRPKTVGEALSLLVKWGDKAQVLAGGTDLLVANKLGLAKWECLVDITGIAELRGIKSNEDGIRIAAATLMSEVASARLIQTKYTALFEAAAEMATTQVRNVATIGGNLCNASPAADTAPPLLVLDAKVEIATQFSTTRVPMEEFFVGPRKTALTTGSIVSGIFLPASSGDHMGTAFFKISRTSSDLATLNTAVAVTMQDNICKEARIAIGSGAPTPIRARKAEAVLKNRRFSLGVIEQAGSTAAEEIKPITDVRATQEYRKDIAQVLVKRSILKAFERAQMF